MNSGLLASTKLSDFGEIQSSCLEGLISIIQMRKLRFKKIDSFLIKGADFWSQFDLDLTPKAPF